MQKLLFIDDDSEFRNVVADLLRFEGYDVTEATNASEGLSLFKKNKFDLIISDVMMESVDGLQFLELVKYYDSQAKVILLTGADSEEVEIRGLELLAEDYIKKPVTMRILCTRIDRVLKKNKFNTVHTLYSKSQNIKVDIYKYKVYKNDELVKLTRKEYDLLVFFLKHKGQTMSRSIIFENVWKENAEHSDLRTVDTHIKKLRSKLSLSTIHTVRGIGYEWNE